jgi:hypothetical protein
VIAISKFYHSVDWIYQKTIPNFVFRVAPSTRL